MFKSPDMFKNHCFDPSAPGPNELEWLAIFYESYIPENRQHRPGIFKSKTFPLSSPNHMTRQGTEFFLGNEWKQLLKQDFLDKAINALSNFKTKATLGSWALLIKGKWKENDPQYQGSRTLTQEQILSFLFFLQLMSMPRFALQIFEGEGLSNQRMWWLCQDSKGFGFSWMIQGDIIF